MTVEHRSHLIEKCHRRAAEARRLADTPGVSLNERDDLLVAERRWLSLAACFGGRIRKRPPHRTVRAQFGHTAPHLGCLIMNYRSDAVWANSDILSCRTSLGAACLLNSWDFMNRRLDEVR